MLSRCCRKAPRSASRLSPRCGLSDLCCRTIISLRSNASGWVWVSENMCDAMWGTTALTIAVLLDPLVPALLFFRLDRCRYLRLAPLCEAQLSTTFWFDENLTPDTEFGGQFSHGDQQRC